MNRRDFFKRLLAATAVLPLVTRLAPKPDFPPLNYIDFPDPITHLHSMGDYLLVFTDRAIYRVDGTMRPYRFDGRRFRAMHIDNDVAVVRPERYL